jgi:hypothetical protein
MGASGSQAFLAPIIEMMPMRMIASLMRDDWIKGSSHKGINLSWKSLIHSTTKSDIKRQ